MTTIGKLLGELKDRKQGRAASFDDAVLKLAKGQRVAPETVEHLLAESDRTAEQLEVAVAVAVQRIGWRKDIAEAKTLDKEVAGIKEKIEVAKQAFANAEKVFNETVWPLDHRLATIAESEHTAHVAKRELIKTCSDTLHAEADQAAATLTELNQSAASLRERCKLIEEAKSDMAEARIQGVGTNMRGTYNEGQRWIDRSEAHQKQGEAAIAELPGVLKEIAQAEKTTKDIVVRMLTV